MNIRQTRQEDLAEVMAIYDYARRFMQEHGNGNQWINGYPSEELISNEIKASHSFVCENEPVSYTHLTLPTKLEV